MPFIMNFQSPKTVEDLLDRFETDGLTNIDHIFHFEETPKEWTVDRTTKEGELVFFACAKTSVDHMARLVREVKASDDTFMDEDHYVAFLAFAEEKYALYQQYAGHLVAVGQVASAPFKLDYSAYEHAAWSSKWYAKIDKFELLDQPVPFSAFREFITISRTGSRTKLTQEQVEQLLRCIEMNF